MIRILIMFKINFKGLLGFIQRFMQILSLEKCWLDENLKCDLPNFITAIEFCLPIRECAQ